LTKLSISQIVSRQIVFDQTVNQPNCQSAKLFSTKLSVKQIVSQPNCQLAKLSVDQIVSRPNCFRPKDVETWKGAIFFWKVVGRYKFLQEIMSLIIVFFCKTKSEWKVWILQWCIFKWTKFWFFRQKNFYFFYSPFETLFTPPFNTL
jgi:hypothetical protein